jgi:hypothetical protein
MLYAFPVLSIFPEHIKKAFYKMYVTICGTLTRMRMRLP